jgi:phage-related tail protein
MYISLEPSPNYSGIAEAAAGENFGSLKGRLYAARVTNTEDLKRVLDEAVKEVSNGRGAVVEVVLNVDQQGNFLTHSK